MPAPLFYFFSAIMLGFGLMVILNRNPVSSGLSLVVSFLGLAALFVSLNAYFVGIIQILVYAGAVMVLFLFIIMLLDIKAEQRRKVNKTAVVGGCLFVFVFVIQLATVLTKYKDGQTKLQDVPLDLAAAAETRKAAGLTVASIDSELAAGSLPDTKLIGEVLFTRYSFHLQVVGVLLLAATIGVIVLSRREDRVSAADDAAIAANLGKQDA